MTSPKDASTVRKITATILCGDDRFHCPHSRVTKIGNAVDTENFLIHITCSECGFEGTEPWPKVVMNAQRVENAFFPHYKLAVVDKMVKIAHCEDEK